MKWLFAVLVALNIIVFGGMVFSKMTMPQQHAAAAPATAAAQPTVVQIHTGNNSTPPNTPGNQTAADTKPTATAVRRNDSKPAGEPNANRSNPSGIQTPSAACTATAVLAEDDYHRIKGLLSRWPHSASRVTERRQNNRTQADRYRLSVAADGDSLRERLQSAGFPNAAISDSQAVLGTFNSEQQAERAAARARRAGFTPEIVRIGSNGTEHSAALGESKIQLTFVEVNNEAAAGISNVIGRYSPLRRAPCNRR